jgi:hypothetical protein
MCGGAWQFATCIRQIRELPTTEVFSTSFLSEDLSEGSFDEVSWIKFVIPGRTSDAQQQYHKVMLAQTMDKYLCLTTKQFAGFIAHKSQKHDRLCLFAGSSVPWIVRERKDGNFELIGEAYIHGIMDGEAIDWKDCDWQGICLA